MGERDNFYDCIRALAVALVFFTHYRGWLPGGTIGVSVFFCLSGFLICGILLRIDLTTPNIAKFIFRRFMRVWPMMAFQVFLVLALMRALQPDLVAKYVPATWGLLTFTEGYSSWVGLGPAVLWTLRAEFWFYVLFPIVLCIAGKRHILQVVISGIAFGVAAKYLIGHGFTGPLASLPYAAKFVPILHTLVYLDNLMFGALCACLIERRSKIILYFRNRAFLWVPICVICLMATDPFVDYTALFYAETSAAALLTAIIILHHTAHPTFGNYEPIATLGRISYSIYLLHAVVIDYFPRNVFDTPLATELIFAVLVGLSMVTYRWIEMPFIALSKRHARFETRSGAGAAPATNLREHHRIRLATVAIATLLIGVLPATFVFGGDAYFSLAYNKWQLRLMNDQPVVLTFICGLKTPIDCHTKLTVSYKKDGDKWCEYLRQNEETADYPTHWCNANPEQNMISVYGGLHSFDWLGRVTWDGHFVGHLSTKG
jgi:peptidoglycan/LPS O-acetylase OafA/YrhL